MFVCGVISCGGVWVGCYSVSLKCCFGRPRTLSGIRFGVSWICSGIVLILFFCFVGFCWVVYYVCLWLFVVFIFLGFGWC